LLLFNKGLSGAEVGMKKVEIFEVTYGKYLEQMAGIDFLSRAAVLGARVVDETLAIPFYGEPHRVSTTGVFNAGGQRATFAVSVLLCCYILQCPEKEPEPGEWVTYREFKDAGPLTSYFTTNTNKIIETTFAGQTDLLKSACREMGGRDVQEPAFDVAFMFQMLPRIPIFFRFNDRDDMFPAQTSILFRQSAEQHIDMECLAIGGTYLIGLFIKNQKQDSRVQGQFKEVIARQRRIL
jgi:hypothetical protein